MIKIQIEKNKKLSVKFGGENFYEILDIVKSGGLEYQGNESKKWIGNKQKFYSIIPLLQEIEKLDCFPSSRAIINFCKPSLEVQRQNIQYNSSLLKSKPFGEFQVEGIKKFLEYNRFLNSDETGLGKSFMIISALNHYFHLNLIDRIFIVTYNASLLYNWNYIQEKPSLFPHTLQNDL